MDISNQVALVTGANRGIGEHFVNELLLRGVQKVYATSRRPELIDIPGVRVLPLDITDPESIRAAAEEASDVTLLINNAGLTTHTPLVTGDLENIRLEMDTHFYGTLDVVRTFAPVLASNNGGAIVNILSALSWFSVPNAGAYSAAKAAEWNLTNAIRLELAPQRILVQAVHLGAADTDMNAGYDGPMIDAREVPRASLDGLSKDAIEVIVDDASGHVKASLAGDPAEFYAAMLGH
ncbi:SDR family oxidoreductase [Curtobacterium sp. VKM Ac-1393]|uniref:SDR family oxidoreductase n=1 Tax=Curtobacterium sp. VKM Ac-1393 TaxID=2783814 RepID=UPI00188BE8FA|nr:SDR family oxidoreductase [Curtobacterium sp. VKM Ac-1393]MBF4609463.1 SDR family oxidoreductase [Curtobacterium sp. VKM Ac-1393]